MPSRNPAWLTITAALDARERVATHADLREMGVPAASLTRKIAPDGPWQRLLPGVVLAHRGTPTHRERLLGAVAFAGRGSIVSGADALRALGARGVPPSAHVLLLVHHDRQKRSFGYVRLERTTRPPRPVARQGIDYAPAARALIDLCRHQRSVADVRAVLAAVVQQRLCTVVEVGAELAHAPRQRTAAARQALAEVADGVRSIAEARARAVIRRSGLPMPQWNVPLLDSDGTPYLTPDAWWPEHGVAMEIDSRRWHLDPESWERTRRRQRRLTAHGILVMSFAPNEIVDAPDDFVSEVRAVLSVSARR
jgi:hypothetical protein